MLRLTKVLETRNNQEVAGLKPQKIRDLQSAYIVNCL